MTEMTLDRDCLAHQVFLDTMDAIAIGNTEEFARLMGDGFGPSDRRVSRILIRDIKIEVGEFYDFTVQEIDSQNKAKPVTMARHIAMYLSRKMTLCSTLQIGMAFGGRDQSTVISAVRRIEGLRATDKRIDNDILTLSKLLGARPL